MNKKDLLGENFKFQKQYGQNFIFDTNLLTAIVKDAKIDKTQSVMEIGVGAATLTKIIAKHAKNVVAFEIDESLQPIISQNLQDVDNAQVVYLDALKAKIEHLESFFENEYTIIANLPYYITTPLIFKFLEQTTKAKKLCVMVQKEVAERLCCKAGGQSYGASTVMIDFYANAKISRIVKRNMFTPVPKVDSAILEIERAQKFECNTQMFSKVVHAAFSMKRKTLLNNLSGGMGLPKTEIVEICEKCNILPSERAENLTTHQFVLLANCFSAK